ncbi:exonuclease SbcCD subunit D [archaeon]|jgi:DNA repair protein SbcD/Mre11|nr:exonuclease SbcCD subunit D [archaeon]
MKFAHLADCHIGGWSDLKLKELNMKVFSKSIQTCIERKVDFVLIAGDLFNTALPSIDLIKETVSELKYLKDNDIPCYIIPGSHDYSPSGKTMLDVLENAGLVINVARFDVVDGKIKLNFVEDKKTGINITGLFGKKGGLEKGHYALLDKTNLESKSGKKIFMFHTTLTEFKPEHLAMISSEPVAMLPKGFDYYAGGHPHYVFNEFRELYGYIAYPGALFPNNFVELEKFEHGGFWINTFKEDKLISEYVPIKLKEIKKYVIDLTGIDSNQANEVIIKTIKSEDILDKIILLRLVGTLNSGKLSDINFREIINTFSGAYSILKNSSELRIKEFDEIGQITDSVEEVEEKLISKLEKDSDFVKNLISILNVEKLDGEKNFDFEDRILKDCYKVLKLENETKIH